jgi:Na+-transporting NADH:ubiquinone oxidoreductase subunit NqrD
MKKAFNVLFAVALVVGLVSTVAANVQLQTALQMAHSTFLAEVSSSFASQYRDAVGDPDPAQRLQRDMVRRSTDFAEDSGTMAYQTRSARP